MFDEDSLRDKLEELKREHRQVDEMIDRLSKTQPVDLFQIQRLKKEKLHVKDMIQKIESMLLPDIIA